jgi:RNA polymerase-binding transcription factor DksA
MNTEHDLNIYARLRLAPQALRCVACESALERGRSRPATL